MGLVVYFVYRGLYIILKRNTICVLAAILVGVVVYFICMILFKAIDVDELNRIPKGRKIVKLFYKFHIIR